MTIPPTQPALNEIDSLRRSERELADFFDNAPIGLHWVGPDGIIVRANRAELELLGYSPNEYIGHHIAEFHADQDVIGDILRRLQAGEELRDYEARLRCKDGSVKHVLMSSNVLWEDGRFIHTRCFTRDITDRKQAEEALLRQTDQFITLVERIPDIVSRLDQNLRFSYISPAVREITGRPPHDYIGKPRTNEGMSPEWVQAREHLSRKVFETGQEQLLEFPIQTPAGERFLECRFIPEFAPDGSVESLMTLTRDVTERKRAEAELRRANADLQQFAYSASHDLQEPIRSVSVYTELLARRYSNIFDEQARHYLRFITSGAQRLEMLVKDLLAYTKSANMEEEPSGEIDAASALSKALSNLSEAIEQSAAEVLHNGLPAVRMREVQLVQLFQNLVGNAIKYRRDDERPRIEVNAERQGPYWQMTVKDNGIGIDPEYRETVFGIFKRLHNDAKYSGTGIGLAICQRIVERNGGRIWVESEGTGKGSTFFFTLPAVDLR